MHDARWMIPLAPLFSYLLAGCPVVGGCDSKYIYSTETVELTPEEYAEWSKGKPMPETTGDPTTSGGTTSDPTTSGGTTTDGSTSDASTTDASTSGGTTSDASTSGGTMSDVTGGGQQLTEQQVCEAVCMHQQMRDLDSCSTMKAADKITITCEFVSECIGGRRHEGVRSHGAGGTGPAAAWLARAAHDEAASVAAFEALGLELAAWGAPAELLARIEAAAEDEVRHAEVTARLAREQGAEVTTPVIAAVPVRDLLAIAIENAVEGCVVETWAALSAAHQAEHAADPQLRLVYRRIAADEARHAELAWAIDAWLCGQLDARARAAVAAARQSAVRALAGRLRAAEDAPELRALGLPSPARAAALCEGLDAALWSQAA